MERPAFSSLASGSDAFAQLKNDYATGNISHAYLFLSPDRLFLTLLSRAFAALCVCGDENSENGIVAQNGLHADVKIYPAADENGKRRETVLTADIDAITGTLYYRPTAGDKKFYIIDYGETMNASCQNKLLKTLEEPPESAYFIINAADKSPLLSTVVSRCRQIKPATFSQESLYAAMRKEFPQCDRIDLAVSASRGMLDYCVRMATDDGYARAFDNALATLLTLKSSKNILANAARVLNYKDRLSETVEFFEMIFRDVMAFHGGGALMCASLKSDMEKLAAEYSLGATVEIMPALYNAKKRLKLNGNPVSVADELLFNIAKLKAQYK